MTGHAVSILAGIAGEVADNLRGNFGDCAETRPSVRSEGSGRIGISQPNQEPLLLADGVRPDGCARLAGTWRLGALLPFRRVNQLNFDAGDPAAVHFDDGETVWPEFEAFAPARD